mgnify:CR=1 FL=1
MSKRYEELDFTDDFIFCKILYNNEPLCKELLEVILGKKIRKIVYHDWQKQIEMTAEGKGVRLDVYLEDGHTVYDLEMQAARKKNLPKRSRYYQGMIDLNLIERGADYEELKESYVIFICTYDLFGKNACVYTFENRCREDNGIVLGDAAVKIFLNAAGRKMDVSRELKAFLDYVAGKPSEDAFVAELERAVREAKRNREWRREYMTLLLRDQENMEKGLKQGRFQSLESLLKASPSLSLEEAAGLLAFTAEELSEYKKERGLENSSEPA